MRGHLKNLPLFGITALTLAGCGATSHDGEKTETVGDANTAIVYNYGTLANPGSCLDALAAGTANGTQLQEYPCNGTGAQAYAVLDQGDGTVNLLNTHANKCVDVYSAGTGDGNKIDLWDCNGTVAQKFVLRPAQNGFVNIVNPNSGKCLDVAGDNPAAGTLVQLWDCNGTNAQLWNPAAVGTTTLNGSSSSPPPASACGTMNGGQSLVQGQSVASCDGRFKLIQQTDGNLVLYYGAQALWATGTVGDGYVTDFQTDGNLVVYSSANAPLWAAGTWGHAGATLKIQDDGNLVIYDTANQPLWASNTSGNYGGSSSGSGSGNASGNAGATGPVPTCAAGERPFLVQNSCSETVWLGLTAGSLGCQTNADCPSGGSTCNSGACTCNQDSDCAPFGQCSPDNHLCFWKLPDLGGSQLQLGQGASATVCFPAPVAGHAAQWSGNLWARTGCDASGQGCATGECGAPAGQPCPVGHGGAPPSTLAEFTLSNQSGANPASDFYDISMINGVNVPVSMTPFAGTFGARANDPYSCGAPGSPTAASSLGGCSWNIQPNVDGVDETTWLHDVPPGGPGCSQDSDCASGQVCGLAQSGGSFSRSCGVAVGWWTADQICGTDPSFGAPFNCGATVTNQNGSTSTTTNLLACSGAQAVSCYSTGASADCCGCGSDASGWPGVLADGFQCANNNPSWESVAMPWLRYMKEACPTAYTYPYDDATSTFTCQPGASTPPVAYAITFCP